MKPPATVADAAEQILKDTDEGRTALHIDVLRRDLQVRYSITITKKNLMNTLNRWVARGMRFKRTAANTYALDGRRRSA